MTPLDACAALAGVGETTPTRWWWETHYDDPIAEPGFISEGCAYWQARPRRSPQPPTTRYSIGTPADTWIEYVELDRRIHDRAHAARKVRRPARARRAQGVLAL